MRRRRCIPGIETDVVLRSPLDSLWDVADRARAKPRLAPKDISFVRDVAPEQFDAFPKLKLPPTVRHPAGFASSLQRLGWSFDFNDLLDQPLLMRDHLGGYREQMQAVRADDVIGQGALLWKMIYSVVRIFQQANTEWFVLKHEDFSLDPVNKYRDLYSKLSLEFTKRVEKEILDSSSSENPSESPLKDTYSVKLDSAANVKNWKKRLDAETIQRIRDITGETADFYYPSENW